MLKRIKETEWHYSQPQEPFPRVPGSGLILGPTGSGKSSLCVQMLLQAYKSVFSRVYVFSPSVDIDDLWEPVRKHNREVLGVDESEQVMWSKWDETALVQIMERQAKMIKHMKENRKKYRGRLLSVAVVIDDFADDSRLHKASGVLASIFTRGRHQGISCWVLSQKLTAVSLIARVNFRWLIVFRLRNLKELLDGVIHELSAITDPKTLRQMYSQATDKPFGYWYINLMKQPGEMFHDGFELQFVV
jgi:Cdc6-like AAA superfamily ATPase